jgi:hypothetical protein
MNLCKVPSKIVIRSLSITLLSIWRVGMDSFVFILAWTRNSIHPISLPSLDDESSVEPVSSDSRSIDDRRLDSDDDSQLGVDTM